MDFYGGYEIVQSPRVTESQRVVPWLDTTTRPTTAPTTHRLNCKLLHFLAVTSSTTARTSPFMPTDYEFRNLVHTTHRVDIGAATGLSNHDAAFNIAADLSSGARKYTTKEHCTMEPLPYSQTLEGQWKTHDLSTSGFYSPSFKTRIAETCRSSDSAHIRANCCIPDENNNPSSATSTVTHCPCNTPQERLAAEQQLTEIPNRLNVFSNGVIEQNNLPQNGQESTTSGPSAVSSTSFFFNEGSTYMAVTSVNHTAITADDDCGYYEKNTLCEQPCNKTIGELRNYSEDQDKQEVSQFQPTSLVESRHRGFSDCSSFTPTRYQRQQDCINNCCDFTTPSQSLQGSRSTKPYHSVGVHDASYTRRILSAFHQWKYDVGSTICGYLHNVKNWTGLGGIEFVANQFSATEFRVFLLGRIYSMPPPTCRSFLQHLASSQTLPSRLCYLCDTTFNNGTSSHSSTSLVVASSGDTTSSTRHACSHYSLKQRGRRRSSSAEPLLRKNSCVNSNSVETNSCDCIVTGVEHADNIDATNASCPSDVRKWIAHKVQHKLENAINSLTFMSYRRDFLPMYRSGYFKSLNSSADDDPLLPDDFIRITSDAGWGCTIRCAQMLLFETLKRHFIGPCNVNRPSLNDPYAEATQSHLQCTPTAVEDSDIFAATSTPWGSAYWYCSLPTEKNIPPPFSRHNRRSSSAGDLSRTKTVLLAEQNSFLHSIERYSFTSKNLTPSCESTISMPSPSSNPTRNSLRRSSSLEAFRCVNCKTNPVNDFLSVSNNVTINSREVESVSVDPLHLSEGDLLELFLDLPSPPTKHPFSVYSFVRSAGGGIGWASPLYGKMPVEMSLVALLRPRPCVFKSRNRGVYSDLQREWLKKSASVGSFPKGKWNYFPSTLRHMHGLRKPLSYMESHVIKTNQRYLFFSFTNGRQDSDIINTQIPVKYLDVFCSINGNVFG